MTIIKKEKIDEIMQEMKAVFEKPVDDQYTGTSEAEIMVVAEQIVREGTRYND